MFGKRLWAVRIVEHAGLSAGDLVGGAIVDLILSIDRQLTEARRPTGVKFGDADAILSAALLALSDERAAQRISEDGQISIESAREYLDLSFQAAEVVAVKFGHERVLEVFRRSNR